MSVLLSLVSYFCVRNEKTDVLVQHQVQIAVEVNRVSAVADNSMTVPRFFIKAVTHRIRRIVERKQPAMHQARRLRLENVNTTELPVL